MYRIDFPDGETYFTDSESEVNNMLEQGGKLSEFGKQPTGGQTSGGDTDEKGKGSNVIELDIPYDSYGNTYGEPGFDSSDIVRWSLTAILPKEGFSVDDLRTKLQELKNRWTPPIEGGTGDGEIDTSQPNTGQTDFRSEYQKELGLTVGNQWVNEFDSSTWPAIAATQSSQWNERTQQFDLKYNRNLPQSNIPGHPQYYENNPEHVLNVKPDVNVEYKPDESEKEIFGWESQAGLQAVIYKPIYNNDYQFIGNETLTLESQSYPKGDGWGYKYRYNSQNELGEWREWIPGP
jgi:hypothetical protein